MSRFRRAWAFDCEWSILPESYGELVAVQYQWIDLTGPTPRCDGPPVVLHARDAATRELCRSVLLDPETFLVGFATHNDTVAIARAYDLWTEVQAAYDAQRVGCGMIQARLLDIARPGKLFEVEAKDLRGLADDDRDTLDDDDDLAEDFDDLEPRARVRRFRVVRKRRGQAGTAAALWIPKRGLPVSMAAVLARDFGVQALEDKAATITPTDFRRVLTVLGPEDAWKTITPQRGTAEEEKAGLALFQLLDEAEEAPVRKKDGTSGTKKVRPGRNALRAFARARKSKRPDPGDVVDTLVWKTYPTETQALAQALKDAGPLFVDHVRGLDEHALVQEEYRRLRALLGDVAGIVRCASAACYRAQPWRFRYGELLDVPRELWPEDAVRYCEDDTIHTAQIWIRGHVPPSDPWAYPNVLWWKHLRVSPTHYAHEADRAEFAFHLENALHPGLRVDRPRAIRTYDAYQRVRDAAGRVLVRHGVADPKGPGEREEGKALESFREEALRTQALAAYADPGAPPPGLTPKGLERYPHLEGLPLSEWPQEAWGCLALAGYQLKRVCQAPPGSDADQLLRLGAPGLVAEAWEPERIEAALEACGYPALAARGLHAKAHAYGRGQVYRLVSTKSGYTRSRASILANTGRISIVGDIGLNTPREGGIRECIVPRPGHVFLDVDYSQIELVCFAMLLDLAARRPIGTGSLSRVLNAGRDAHLVLAGDLLVYQGLGAGGLEPYDYETLLICKAGRRDDAVDALVADGASRSHELVERVERVLAWAHGLGLPKKVKAARQDAKPVNYGQGANMSNPTFARTQAKVGHPISLADAERGKAAFWRRWQPEPYFDRVARLQREAAEHGVGVNLVLGAPTLTGRIADLSSALVRGGLTYTETANTFFQTIVAMGFARAFTRLCRASRDRHSPLYQFCPRLPVHDQVLVEGPAERAEEALAEQHRIMIAAMSEVLPGMVVSTSGEIRADAWGK